MSELELKITPKYTLMDSSADMEHWNIRIDEGPFQDVVYKYKTVNIADSPVIKGHGVLKWTFEIVYDAELPEVSANPDFIQVMGDILYNMLQEMFSKEKK